MSLLILPQTQQILPPTFPLFCSLGLPSTPKKTTMRTQSLLLLTATLLLLIAATQSLINPSAFSSPAPTPATNPLPTQKDMDFIRTSCESTEYPQVCYASLAHYASSVQQNPALLARVAIFISLSRARLEAGYFSNMSKEADYGADHLAAQALHDCFSVFGDAVDQIHGSLSQMRHLVVGGSGETFQFQISNVQTWMSAALTNEDTCTQGFDGVAAGPMKRDVYDHVKRVEAVTSNALALVNHFAAQVTNLQWP